MIAGDDDPPANGLTVVERRNSACCAIVAKCHNVLHFAHMAKSVRVSDRLYELADAASAGAHRSLAQQIEYWAALGRAIEAAGVATVQIQRVLEGDLRARERTLLKLGLANPESMYLFPIALAQGAKVRFPELEEKRAP